MTKLNAKLYLLSLGSIIMALAELSNTQDTCHLNKYLVIETALQFCTVLPAVANIFILTVTVLV